MKAAFTRAYQKNAPMLPYVINNNATAKKKSSREDDAMEEEEDDDEEQNDITSDKMIKVTENLLLQDSIIIQKHMKG